MDATLIVIDGPAGVGKGTVSLRLAKHFGYQHVDSGLLYRAVGVIACESDLTPFEIASWLTVADLARTDLRTELADRAAASVAAIPTVREAVNHSLRRMISEPPGTIMDGRAGAYEFPEAQVKIFLTARDDVRVERRRKQFKEAGTEMAFEKALESVRTRDNRDRERSASPMIPSKDAIIIDNSDHTEDFTFSELVRICEPFVRKTASV